jgi:hypothetical protein
LTIIEPEKPPPIIVPDFGYLRTRRQVEWGNFWKDNTALIAAGQIPDLNLNVEGKAHSSATSTLSDGRRVSLTFDEHSHISQVEVTSEDGDRDLASIENGKIMKETRTAKGSEVSYLFDAQGKISQEIIHSSDDAMVFDFKDGNIVRARGASLKDGTSDDFIDQPDVHTYSVAQPDGQKLKFEYDQNGKFQFGTDHQLGKGGESTEKTWLISPNGHGGITAVRGQEV